MQDYMTPLEMQVTMHRKVFVPVYDVFGINFKHNLIIILPVILEGPDLAS